MKLVAQVRAPMTRVEHHLSPHIKPVFRGCNSHISSAFRGQEQAMSVSQNQKSVVDDITVAIFRPCSHTRWGRVVRARKKLKDIPSLPVICGDIKYAETVIDGNGIILLVQEDQRYFDSSGLSLNCLPKRSPYLLKTTRCGRGHTALILKLCLESCQKGPRVLFTKF